MLKPAIKRSACDLCRAKRVRCLRPQDSTAPCARCRFTGAQCVTGAAGHPGRPLKQRCAVPSPGDHLNSMSGDTDNVQVLASFNTVVPASARASNSTMHAYSSRDLVAHESQQDFWLPPGDISTSIYSPSASMDQSPVLGHNVLSLPDRLNSPSQLQAFLGAGDDINTMLLIAEDTNSALGMEIEPLLDQGENLLPTTPLQHFNTKKTLARFQDEIEEHIAIFERNYSDALKALERCKDEDTGRDVEKPGALLLTCTKEFTDIIQSLSPATQSDTSINDALSTETVLLVLSSYLAWMRLFDCVFQRIYNYLCELSLDSWEPIKVKSVLRIGGVSLLHDMPLTIYAMGVLEAIKAQVQILERYLGIPTEYCLSGETNKLLGPEASGIFSSPPRARLLRATMEQEDLKSLRGSKSYAESIRASMKNSVAFLKI